VVRWTRGGCSGTVGGHGPVGTRDDVWHVLAPTPPSTANSTKASTATPQTPSTRPGTHLMWTQCGRGALETGIKERGGTRKLTSKKPPWRLNGPSGAEFRAIYRPQRSGARSGRYWDRTSDLCSVKVSGGYLARLWDRGDTATGLVPLDFLPLIVSRWFPVSCGRDVVARAHPESQVYDCSSDHARLPADSRRKHDFGLVLIVSRTPRGVWWVRRRHPPPGRCHRSRLAR